MTAPANERQRLILTFLQEHARDHDYPPRLDEIGDAVGLRGKSNVSLNLAALEAQGLVRLERASGRVKAIWLAEDATPRALLRDVLEEIGPLGNILSPELQERLRAHLGEGCCGG